MATTGDKPKKGERLRSWMEFVFGFENKRGELLDWWIYSADGFSLAPQEFYNALERHLEGYKIPGMAISREEFPEGGLLSDQRIYLRLMRERLAIDTCAAPFGNIYFFSCRTVHVPALVRLWHILAAITFLSVIGDLLVKPLGFTFAIVAVVMLMFAVAGVLRNAGSSAISDLDALLLKIPVVAIIYEDWFRVDTYYRDDSRELYRKLLPGLVQEAAEEVTAAKGVKLVREHQFPPVLKELHQPPQKEKTGE